MQSPTGYHQRSIALCLSSHSQIHEKVLIYRPHPYVSRKFTPAIGMRVHVKLVGRFLALLMFFPPISGSSVRQDGFARSPLTLSFPRRRESIPLGQCFTYKVQMHPWDEKGTPTCLGIPLVRIRRIRRITDKRYPVTPTGVLRELFCVTSLKKDLCHQNGGGGIPGFALEPKFAEQLSIGAPPLWRSLCSLSPRRRGKIAFPTPF